MPCRCIIFIQASPQINQHVAHFRVKLFTANMSLITMPQNEKDKDILRHDSAWPKYWVRIPATYLYTD